MNHERYQQLQRDEKAELTREEIADGWHFCHEFDGLLTQGELGPGKCCCGTFENGKWARVHLPSISIPEPEASPPPVTGPQPIETAPKDGTVILSDCGLVRYLVWSSDKSGVWIECNPDGCGYSDRHDNALECTPKQWTPLPDWVKQ